MIIQKTALIILGSLLAASAYAGGGSHGGDSVVCFNSKEIRDQVDAVLTNNKYEIDSGRRKVIDPLSPLKGDLSLIKSVELFELHLERQSGLNSLLESRLSVDEILRNRLQILEEKSHFAQQIQQAQSALPFVSWIKSKFSLLDVPDSGRDVELAENCLVMQVAYQQATGPGSEIKARLFYDNRLYELMSLYSPVDAAALQLHEWIYYIQLNKTLSRIVENSRNVQDITVFLMSTDLENLNRKQVDDFLSSVL